MALMPSPMPGGPAPPPAGPPGGTGPATTPGPMAGAASQGLAGLKTAIELLQKSVSSLPMGSPAHTKVLKFLADISKDIGEQGGDADAMKQQVAQMARQGPNPQAQQAMAKLMPQPAATPPQAAA